MLSRISSRVVPFFSFAQIKGYPQVSDKLFRQYYSSNMEEMAIHFGELSKLGLRANGILKLFKQKPTLFKSKQGDFQIKNIIINLLNKHGRKALPPIQKFPKLVEGNELQYYVDLLEKYKFTQDQIMNIFVKQPQALTDKLQSRIQATKKLLVDDFNIRTEECNDKISNFPFILMATHNKYRLSAKFLQARGFNFQVLREMLFRNLDIFDLGVKKLKTLFDAQQQWGVEKDLLVKYLSQIIEYLSKNSKLITSKNKVNTVKAFKIPERIAEAIFEKYPSIMISSQQSYNANLILANQKLKIPLPLIKLLPFLIKNSFDVEMGPKSGVLGKGKNEQNKEQLELENEYSKNATTSENVPKVKKNTDKNIYGLKGKQKIITLKLNQQM